VSEARYDKEIERYRSLMEAPGTFEDGFSWTALAGALFVALLMVPGAMYMQLLAGYWGIGQAAQWVTVILFIEVARRAHKHLSKPEIFVLFYMAAAVMVQPFSGLLYRQFFVQSKAATGMGIADKIPGWFAPSDQDILSQRNFFHATWYLPIALVVFQTVMGRLNTAILSYGLFRLASDIEKLPFPMAPVGAQGITALYEQQSEESKQSRGTGNWRWRVFAIGGILGLSFGAVYLALPAISTAVLDKPITILPIPFVEWTPKTNDFLPAVPTGLSLDMGNLVLGMVLPFYAMLGSFLALIMTVIANPILYQLNLLPSWTYGDDTIYTNYHNYIDFYFSFGLGVAIAIGVMGIWQIYRGLRTQSKLRKEQKGADFQGESPYAAPPGRGDIRTRWVIVTYLATSIAYILVCGFLINWHPTVMVVLLFFAFLYTPLLSYVTARLEGMAGQMVQIPYVREAAFIVSGYKGGVDIWFLPVPLANYGQRTVFYRQAELTGTKFWSIWKAEIILVPIVLVAAIMFAQFIWSLAEIPGPQYPYAEKMWELNAAQRSVIYTSTLGRYTPFEKAFRPDYMAVGAGVGLALFGLTMLFNLPMMIVYGIVRGLNTIGLPHIILPQFIGACIGRFYFERKMGLTWRKYVPVVAAGFFCGTGLITVLGVGVNFLAKSVIKIPY